LIAVAAPAGPFDRKKFHHGVFLLKQAGFGMALRKDITDRRGYLAGDDARRASELNEALASPFSALLFARGGYGCQRIVPRLNGKIHPKIVMGSSDLTVVLIHLWKKYGMPSYYGPMVAPHLTQPKTVKRVARALMDARFFDHQPIVAKAALKGGSASGVLVGGCLSLVIATLGTPWELDTRGKILFLEDTNEEPYAVDRMITQLEQAGKLKGAKGLVFGTFKQGKTLFPSAIRQVLQDKLKKFRGPILWGVRFGHCKDPLIIPFGGQGRIRSNRLVITRGIF
jgi:muramoyltetrapeptide carboxypeptidase